MKWDIDKALRALEDSQIPGTTVSRVFLYGTETMERAGLVPTAEELTKDSIFAWCLALGKIQERKLFVYGRTIRSAYLKARKIIKSLSAEDLAFFGLKAPNRSNSFLAARGLKKRKSKEARPSV